MISLLRHIYIYPCPDSLQNATGVILGGCISPFAETPRVQDVKQKCPPRVGRCKYCDSYINIYNIFDHMGWICSLCHSLNEYSDSSNARYLGGEEIRKLLPELQGNVIDLCLDDGSLAEELQPRVNPLIWTVIDVTCQPDSLQAIKEALLTSIETMLRNHHFALSLLDDQYIYIMNWKSRGFHRLPSKSGEQRLCDQVEYSQVVQPVSVIRDVATSIIGQLKPKLPCKKVEDTSVLGESLRNIFAFLANAQADELPTHLNGSPLGSRMLLFFGSGLLETVSGRLEEVCNDHRDEDMGFYIDPLNADLPMIEPRSRPGELVHSTTDTMAHKLFTGAGATAAILGIAVNLFVMEECPLDFGCVSPIAYLSGGSFGSRYCSRGTIVEDLYKVITRIEYLDCSIRLRTSIEVSVTEIIDNRPGGHNGRGSDFFQLLRVSQEDGFGVLFDHVDGHGMSGRTPLYIQLAIGFTALTNGSKNSGSRVRRYLRIITQELPLASSIAEVLPFDDMDTQLYLEFKTCMRLLDSFGKQKSVEFLRTIVEGRISARVAYLQDAEYQELEQPSKSYAQSSFHAFTACMKNLICIIEGEKDETKERLDLLRSLDVSNSSCNDVTAAIHPVVSYWTADGNALLHTSIWDTSESFDSAVCLVDTHDLLILYQPPGNDKVRSHSRLMQYVGTRRKWRFPTPLFEQQDDMVFKVVSDRIFYEKE